MTEFQNTKSFYVDNHLTQRSLPTPEIVLPSLVEGHWKIPPSRLSYRYDRQECEFECAEGNGKIENVNSKDSKTMIRYETLGR